MISKTNVYQFLHWLTWCCHFCKFCRSRRRVPRMKIIKMDWRSRLTDDSVSDLMTIKLNFPDIKDFDQQPTIDVWLQKKRMPYFSNNRSRFRREQEDGPAEIPGGRDAHHMYVLKTQQDIQAAVPVPSDDAKDDDDRNLSDYLLLWWWTDHWWQVDRSRKWGLQDADSNVLIICVALAVATNCKHEWKLY